MPLVVSISLDDVYTKLKTLLTDVLPVNVDINQGLGNRVSMPAPDPGFVTMTAVVMTPHRTPVASWDANNPAVNTIQLEQGTLMEIQLDCYGATSQQWAVILQTVFRDDYACRALAPFAPLYCDPPMLAALVNGEDQYEQRWIVRANMQYNPIVTAPQDFANTLAVTVVNVDEAFPP